jgi:hypothetical protein
MKRGFFKEYRFEYAGNSPHIAIPVPGLPNTFDSEVAGIKEGRMLFKMYVYLCCSRYSSPSFSTFECLSGVSLV